MVLTFKQTSYQDLRTRISKTIVGLFVLAYFGPAWVICNDNIPFCKDRFEELRKDEKSWLQRCVDDKGQVVDKTYCEGEKNYNLERMCMNTKICFNTGNAKSSGILRFRLIM